MKMLRNLLHGVVDLFFPSCCPVCGRHLVEGEAEICFGCLADMPRLRFTGQGVAEVEGLFLGSPLVERAASMFRYNRLSPYAELLKDVKYRNNPHAAEALARLFSVELKALGFFDGADAIVPVPLHRGKLQKRGYNQSRFVADGLSRNAGVPVEELLRAVRPHATQTFRSADDRRRNVAGVFRADTAVRGMHIVLVDDVITTGSTLTACCDALQAQGAASVRIVSLAFANTAND